MLAYIKGFISKLTPTFAIIETKEGLGYHLHISLHTYSAIQGRGDTLLYTYLHISGGAQNPIVPSLFGFSTEEEREIFIQLLSVSGVGAATVRLILSSMQPVEVVSAITNGDVPSFQRVKGIGGKTAQRIILELKDKVGKASSGVQAISSGIVSNNAAQEALSALVMLGFSRSQAQTVLQKIVRTHEGTPTVEGLIKEALKHL